MVNFIKSLLGVGGVSCKKFLGSIILFMLCGCYVYCTIVGKEMLQCTDAFLITAGVLLGIRTVMSPFQKGSDKGGEGQVPASNGSVF